MDMFTIVPILIGVVFVIVIGIILIQAGKGVAEWADNNAKPVLSERARVVAKRSKTSGTVHSNTGGGGVSTWYYATFELPSGDRREFSVAGEEYGLLCEGDEGTLTFQGTRYHGFKRVRA
jgi:hypothetical protein